MEAVLMLVVRARPPVLPDETARYRPLWDVPVVAATARLRLTDGTSAYPSRRLALTASLADDGLVWDLVEVLSVAAHLEHALERDEQLAVGANIARVRARLGQRGK